MARGRRTHYFYGKLLNADDFMAEQGYLKGKVRMEGFSGFVSVASLRDERCRSVPAASGVYVVIRDSDSAPSFRKTSGGGWFKGKDPTVPVATLRRRWIADTPVLYIGKATSLRDRVKALVDYGGGKPVGHQGGRYLWQVAGSDDFLVGWADDSDPRGSEIRLMGEFQLAHGSLPFANLQA